MSDYRRRVIDGVVFVEDLCREDFAGIIERQRGQIAAQSQEIARQHALLMKALPIVTEAAPVKKGGE